MHALTVTDVAATIVEAGHRDFVHIRNMDDEDTVYVGYDGSATALTPSNGFPILPGGTLLLDNIDPKRIYVHAIKAVCDTGKTAEVRIQGAAEP